MDEIDAVWIARASYENVAAECPWCHRECTFNRVSDLGTVEPVTGRDVQCLHPDCGRPFRIIGDTANNAHETLIYDAYVLLDRKQYMNCVLSLAQAYEMFFSLYLRVKLVYRSYAADSEQLSDSLNGTHQALLDKTQAFAFGDMRKLFLHHMVAGPPPKDLVEANAAVSRLSRIAKGPSEQAIEALDDPELVRLLKAVQTTEIGNLRNAVVHKQGYRPSAAEALACLRETRDTLFPLTQLLDLHDDVMWYVTHLQSEV